MLQKPLWKGLRKAEECPETCLNITRNGECNDQCNLLKCFWDGGDCDTVSAEGDDKTEAYFATLDYANLLLDTLKSNPSRHFISHTPHLYSSDIMNELQTLFPVEYNLTSSHRRQFNCPLLLQDLIAGHLTSDVRHTTRLKNELRTDIAKRMIYNLNLCTSIILTTKRSIQH